MSGLFHRSPDESLRDRRLKTNEQESLRIPLGSSDSFPSTAQRDSKLGAGGGGVQGNSQFLENFNVHPTRSLVHSALVCISHSQMVFLAHKCPCRYLSWVVVWGGGGVGSERVTIGAPSVIQVLYHGDHKHVMMTNSHASPPRDHLSMS